MPNRDRENRTSYYVQNHLTNIYDIEKGTRDNKHAAIDPNHSMQWLCSARNGKGEIDCIIGTKTQKMSPAVQDSA